MTGFGNYLSKLKGISAGENIEDVEETKEKDGKVVPAPKDFRGRMEDKLRELKQKQADKEKEQKERDQQHAGDIFV